MTSQADSGAKPTRTAKNLARMAFAPPARRWLRRQPLRVLRWFRKDAGLFRRTIPVDNQWGGKRGRIIDRYYIEKFLSKQDCDVRGYVLEFGDDAYAHRFGKDKITRVEVLDLNASNKHATIVADLSHGESIPSDAFDCVICTQVLLLVFNIRAAVQTLYRILKPGGVVLVTVPGIQKISRGDMETCGDYWRFTEHSLRRLFEEVFPRESIDVKASGNVLAATAFLHGLAVEDLRQENLDIDDPDFPVSIALRASKPGIEEQKD